MACVASEWFRGAAPLDRALAAYRCRDASSLLVSHEWRRGEMVSSSRVFGIVDAAQYMQRVLAEPYRVRAQKAQAALLDGKPSATRGEKGISVSQREALCAFGHVVQLREKPCYFRLDVDAHKVGTGEDVMNGFLERALPELTAAVQAELLAVGADPSVSVHCCDRLVHKPSFRVAGGLGGAPFATLRDLEALWDKIRERLTDPLLLAPGVLDANFSDRRTDRMLGMSKLGEDRPLLLEPDPRTSDRASREFFARAPLEYLLRYHGASAPAGDSISIVAATAVAPLRVVSADHRGGRAEVVRRALREIGFEPPALREKTAGGTTLFIAAEGQPPLCLFREGDRCAPEETENGVIRYMRPRLRGVVKHSKTASKVCFWLRHGRLYSRCFSCIDTKACRAQRELAVIPPAWLTGSPPP